MFNCSWIQTANQPTACQQLNVFRHRRCGEEDLLKFTLIRMEKKGDWNGFECGMAITAISRVYREWSQKGGEKKTVSGSCVEGNALLKSGVRGQNGQPGWRRWKDNSKWKDHWLKPESAEQHVWMLMNSNLEADIFIYIYSAASLWGNQKSQGAPEKVEEEYFIVLFFKTCCITIKCSQSKLKLQWNLEVRDAQVCVGVWTALFETQFIYRKGPPEPLLRYQLSSSNAKR